MEDFRIRLQQKIATRMTATPPIVPPTIAPMRTARWLPLTAEGLVELELVQIRYYILKTQYLILTGEGRYTAAGLDHS